MSDRPTIDLERIENEHDPLPRPFQKLCATMPYGAAAGRVPGTYGEFHAWLVGLRSVLAGVARESEQTGAALRELEQQRAAVRALLGTES